MHRPAPLRLGMAVLAVSGALILSSCGSEGAENPSADEPQSSRIPEAPGGAQPEPQEGDEGATDALDTPTADDTVSTVSFDALTTRVAAAIEKGRTARMLMTATLGESVTRQEGHIDYGSDPVALSLSMEYDESVPPTDVIMVGGFMYSTMGDGNYMKTDLTDEGTEVLDLSQFEPAKAMLSYGKAVKDVQALGTKNFAGEQLEGFEATLVTSKAIAGATQDSGFPATFAYRVWFDKAGYVRRAENDMGKAGTTVLTYDDWGTAAKIAVPPASKVQELPELPTAP